MAAHRFELVGGDPSLDFLNTIHDWTEAAPRDYLPDYAEALRFGIAAGVITRAEAARLAAQPPGREVSRLRDLRSTLERVARARLTPRSPSRADLDALGREAAEAARHARLEPARGRMVRGIPAVEPAVLRWRLADAAVALLTSERWTRVKACPTCGWFFVDVSKNGSRRWCSMAMCGGIAKARRYYWRTRAT